MTFRDRIATTLEYLIALMFIRGGLVVLFGQDDGPEYLPGIFTYLVGEYAVIVYGILFLAAGILLLYAKWFKNKKLHKWMLLTMFLTAAYIGPLAVATNGFEWAQLQVVVVLFISAWLYLRWKLKTEYINPSDFFGEVDDGRN